MSKARDDVSPLCNGRPCAGAWEKVLRTFAHSVGIFNTIISSSDIGVLACTCVCTALLLSRATKASPILRATEHVEARDLHLHPPFSAFVQSRLEFLELLVARALTAASVICITSMYHAGTTW